jgi:hypothetical protein
MPGFMPLLRDAFLRHAWYYESLSRQADNLYFKGHEGVARGLSLFDSE